MSKNCLLILLCFVSGISSGQSQESEPANNSATASGAPTIHYAFVGESSGIQVVIDLDKCVIEWFEKNVAGFDRMGQTEKDDIARRLLADDSLDYVDIRLVNKTSETILLNVMEDTLTVSFKKALAKYRPDAENTNYPSRLVEDSHTEVRFPIATTTDAKMGIGRLAASLSRIDYLIRSDLQRGPISDPAQANGGASERPEARMAPIARSILEQDLFGEFFLGEEGLAIPLVFRISTTDVEEHQ